MVERRNQVMEKMIDVASSNGDFSTADDVKIHCALAASVCNLEHDFNGHTVLEYLTEEALRTHQDLVSHTEVAEALSGLDSEFLTQLQHILQEHNLLVQTTSDNDARYNALVCDATGSRQRTTQFTLRPGDQASYDGDKYVLLDIVSSTPTVPAKARSRVTTHEVTKT